MNLITNHKEHAMKFSKIAAVAALTLAAFVAGPVASAATSTETLTINTTVTITVALDITWYGNAGDASNSTVDDTGGLSTTLTANTDSARAWDLTNGSTVTLDQGSAAKTTIGGAYANYQFVIANVGNARVDYTAMVAANADGNGVTWVAGATGTSTLNEYVMQMKINGGTFRDLTGAFAKPGADAAFDNHVVAVDSGGGVLTPVAIFDLSFTPPVTVNNAGVVQTIVTSIRAING